MLGGFDDGDEFIFFPDTFTACGSLQDLDRVRRQCRHGPATAGPFVRTVAELGECGEGSGVIGSGPAGAVLRRDRRRRVARRIALGQVAEDKTRIGQAVGFASVAGFMPVTRRL
jgi:hypothetical protein